MRGESVRDKRQICKGEEEGGSVEMKGGSPLGKRGGSIKCRRGGSVMGIVVAYIS